jgi:drug/metabolite transporter (DMT)-like permease
VESSITAQNRIQAFNPALLLIFAAILWSMGGLFIKLISISGPAIAGFRCLLGALFLLIFIKRRNFNFSFAQILGAVSVAIGTILFVLATKLTTAANAILLQYTSPVYIAIFGAIFLKERVSIRDIIMMFCIGAGMVLFFFDKLSPGNLMGNILALISGMNMAVCALSLRKQKDGSPLESVFLGLSLAALVCVPFMMQARPTSSDWLIMGASGVIQLASPYILYSIAIKKLQVLNASLIATLEPVLNPIWVFLMIGERPGNWALAGGLIVISTVIWRAATSKNGG